LIGYACLQTTWCHYRRKGALEKVGPLFIAFFAFCFVIACGTVWEIIEFTSDRLFGTDMQRWLETGVVDTMKDIIEDVLGGLILSVDGYIYLKRGGDFGGRESIMKATGE